MSMTTPPTPIVRHELGPDQERLALRLASMLALQRQPGNCARSRISAFASQHRTSHPMAGRVLRQHGEGERVIAYIPVDGAEPQNPGLDSSGGAANGPATPTPSSPLEKAVTQAQPPTLLQQELVRMHLAGMQTATAENNSTGAPASHSPVATNRRNLPGDLDTLNLLGELLFKDGQLPEASPLTKGSHPAQGHERQAASGAGVSAMNEKSRPSFADLTPSSAHQPACLHCRHATTNRATIARWSSCSWPQQKSRPNPRSG